jgi:hypothetical protein
VGSGKSSLLSVIIGDIRKTEDDVALTLGASHMQYFLAWSLTGEQDSFGDGTSESTSGGRRIDIQARGPTSKQVDRHPVASVFKENNRVNKENIFINGPRGQLAPFLDIGHPKSQVEASNSKTTSNAPSRLDLFTAPPASLETAQSDANTQLVKNSDLDSVHWLLLRIIVTLMYISQRSRGSLELILGRNRQVRDYFLGSLGLFLVCLSFPVHCSLLTSGGRRIDIQREVDRHPAAVDRHLEAGGLTSSDLDLLS